MYDETFVDKPDQKVRLLHQCFELLVEHNAKERQRDEKNNATKPIGSVFPLLGGTKLRTLRSGNYVPDEPSESEGEEGAGAEEEGLSEEDREKKQQKRAEYLAAKALARKQQLAEQEAAAEREKEAEHLITPEQVVFVLRSIDPIAQTKTTLDELQALVAAELLMDSIDDVAAAKMSLFEAVSIFHKQSKEELVTFRDFCIMFDGKSLNPNCATMVKNALNLDIEFKKRFQATESDEHKKRKEILVLEEETVMALESQLRRARNITQLRQQLSTGFHYGKKSLDAEILAEASQADAKRLHQLKEEQIKVKEEGKAFIESVSALEQKTHDVERDIGSYHEQVLLMRQWKDTAVKLVATETEKSWGDLIKSLQKREEALSAHLDRVEEKLIIAGRNTMVKSLQSGKGYEGHKKNLASWQSLRGSGNRNTAASRRGDGSLEDPTNFDWLISRPLHDEASITLDADDVNSRENKERQWQVQPDLFQDASLVSCQSLDRENAPDNNPQREATLSLLKVLAERFFTEDSLPNINQSGGGAGAGIYRAMNYDNFKSFIRCAGIDVPGSTAVTFFEFSDLELTPVLVDKGGDDDGTHEKANHSSTTRGQLVSGLSPVGAVEDEVTDFTPVVFGTPHPRDNEAWMAGKPTAKLPGGEAEKLRRPQRGLSYVALAKLLLAFAGPSYGKGISDNVSPWFLLERYLELYIRPRLSGGVPHQHHSPHVTFLGESHIGSPSPAAALQSSPGKSSMPTTATTTGQQKLHQDPNQRMMSFSADGSGALFGCLQEIHSYHLPHIYFQKLASRYLTKVSSATPTETSHISAAASTSTITKASSSLAGGGDSGGEATRHGVLEGERTRTITSSTKGGNNSTSASNNKSTTPHLRQRIRLALESTGLYGPAGMQPNNGNPFYCTVRDAESKRLEFAESLQEWTSFSAHQLDAPLGALAEWVKTAAAPSASLSLMTQRMLSTASEIMMQSVSLKDGIASSHADSSENIPMNPLRHIWDLDRLGASVDDALVPFLLFLAVLVAISSTSGIPEFPQLIRALVR